MPRLGVIVNPIAGMGGSVGLKGTDTPEILADARARGAEPRAPGRMTAALSFIKEGAPEDLEVLTAAGPMGADEARAAGFEPTEIGSVGSETSATDTQAAAREMAAQGVDIVLFAGGDGTARDLVAVLGTDMPALGVPAGVKMHSAVYAKTPRSAASAVLEVLTRQVDIREHEVMDIDEAAFRTGSVSARLYGYLAVPHLPALVQGVKAGGVSGDKVALAGIAADIVERMEEGRLYILGPGTTTRAVARALGLEKTLLGVDMVRDRKLIAQDVGEAEIAAALEEAGEGTIIVTPIGGQGHFIGRGNQQISADVIRRVGVENILVAATMEKLASLDDQTLQVDTGDEMLDKALSGWRRVVTGYHAETVCRVAA